MEWNRSAASHQPQSDKKQPKGIFNPESALWKSINFKEVVIPLLPEMDYIAFNDFGKPSHHAMAYTNDTSVLRYNHPLHIMVSFVKRYCCSWVSKLRSNNEIDLNGKQELRVRSSNAVTC